MKASLLERFEDKYFVAPDSCWLWTAAVNRSGYGVLADENRMQTTAHRISYRLFVDEIPDGLHVDHLCFNRTCVNPYHLEAVTPYVNTRRRSDRITHCPRGHEYNEENTYTWREGKGSQRHCRKCKVASHARWRAKKKGDNHK